MGGRTTNKVVTKRGNIGQQTFDEVERLTAAGDVNKLAAFKQLAASTGKNVGTVAANYYRIARMKGVALRPRGPAAGSRTGPGSGRISATLRVLERLLQAQEEEIARLRKENARFAQLRRLLA